MVSGIYLNESVRSAPLSTRKKSRVIDLCCVDICWLDHAIAIS